MVRTLRVPSLLLAAVLQLMPMVRVALPAVPSASNIIVILFRWCAGAAAALGSVHAVSGGSTRITSPLQAVGTNGVPFSLRLTTAPDQAHWWAGSNVPPGLSVSGSGALWSLSGTPTTTGTFNVRLTAKDVASSGRDRTTVATLVMTILDPTNIQPIPLIVPGTYSGVAIAGGAPRPESSALVTVAVQRYGTFKATWMNGRKKYPFAGQFDVNGDVTNSVARAGLSTLTVEMHLDLFGGNVVTGRVVDGGTATPFSAGLKTASSGSKAGQYTLLIPGAESGDELPLGDGAASLKIDAKGGALISGALADGSRLLVKSLLDASGNIPVYAPLYNGRGALVGTLHVKPSANVDLDGRLYWLRPAGPIPATYPNGFALSADILGSAYTPPTDTWFGAESARVILAGGNFPDAVTNAVDLLPGGKVSSAGPDKITFAVTPTTGLFKGTLTQTGSRPIKFQGAVLERHGFGGGSFLGSTNVGRVYFGP